MLHPALAHFAMVLPVIAFIFGVAYLLKPSEVMSKFSTRFMVFAAIFLVLAFFSGRDDGGEVYALLSEDGQKLLMQHKDLGLYLSIAMIVSALLKLFGCRIISYKAEVFSILLLGVVTFATLYQGKMGGDLTYMHGANVMNHSDGLDCLEDPSDFLEEE